MKKLLALFLSTLFVISCFSVPAIATGAIETEDNNTSNLANSISNATTITGKLQTMDDVDWYKFTANADYFVVDFKVGSNNPDADVNHGWKVTAYDSKLNELYSDITEGSLNFPRLSVSGICYIKVEARYADYMNSPEGVEYEVKATNYTDAKWESEYNNSSTTANVISAGSVYSGYLRHYDDIDWYTVNTTDYFTVNFGKKLDVIYSDDIDNGWKITIYDSSLNTLYSFLTESNATSYNIPYAGKCYIKIEARHADYLNSPEFVYYSFKVTNYTDANWEREYNNTAATANVKKANTILTGMLSDYEDVDWYKFTATDYSTLDFGESQYPVFATDENNGWKVTIYNSQMTEVYSFTTGGMFNTGATPRFSAKGTCYVKVEARHADYLNSPELVYYKLRFNNYTDSKWEKEPNDTLTKAISIKSGTTYKGNLLKDGDVDNYKIKVTTAGTVTIKFNRDVADNDGDGFYVEVKTSGGSSLKKVNVNDKSKSSISVKVSKGTYYVAIYTSTSGWFSSPVSAYINYKVSYTFKPSTPSLKKVTPAKKALKASWKQAKYVDGYQVQYATSKSFKKAKTTTVKKYKTTSKTIKKLKAKKTYYVRIRTFKKVDGKNVYSSWSKAKKAKTKK